MARGLRPPQGRPGGRLLSRPLPRTARWLALLLALAALGAACDGGDERAPAPEETPTDVVTAEDADVALEDARGGTAVWGFAQEPLTLNPTVEDGNLLATTQAALATVLPLWVITPEFEYEPTALLDRAEVSDDDAFSVTYHLAEDASWSDGTPVTAGDVFFTLQTCLDTRWAITTREACSAVDMPATEEGLEADGKVIEVVFLAAHAPWQTLFSTADGVILPSHLLEGQDWSSAWDDEIPIASGPFRFESWERGRQLTLVRNEAYVGRPAHLDRIVFAFAGAPEELAAGMRAGELGLLEPPPQLDLVRQLEAIRGVEVQTAAGTVWEHVSFQLEHELLGAERIRRALSQAIDREALVELLVAPIHPDAEPLGSLVHVRGQPAYEDHFGDLHDPESAVALLEGSGCRRGDDDVFACQGRRLAFEYTTTAGDERRELTFELLRDQLAGVGVELTPRFVEPAVLFGELLPSGAWELSGFAWVAGPDPVSNAELWRCDGAHNHTGYCDDLVTDLLQASTAQLDPQNRAAIVNRVGRRLAEAVPAVPLYQRPSVLAVDGAVLSGPQLNPTLWGQVWNVTEWRALGR